MTNGYVIEIDEVAAGLLVREGGSWAFHAVERKYASLEGVVFAGPQAAERAARRLAHPSNARPKPAPRPIASSPGWADSMLSGALGDGPDRTAPAWI